MSFACRLCLITISDAYKALSDINEEYFSAILPEIDLNIIKSTAICCNCFDQLQSAYSFKERCLEAEKVINDHLEKIKPDTVHELNLEDVLDLKYEDVKSETEDNIECDDNADHEVEMESKCEKSSEGNFGCKLCHKKYSRAGNLNRHTTNVHKNVKSRRKSKKLIKKTRKEVEAIIRKHDEIYTGEYDCILLCEICRETFESKPELFKHIRSHFHIEDSESQETFECDICGSEHETKKDLLTHIQGHFETIICRECDDEKFFDSGKFKEHMFEVHKTEVFLSLLKDRSKSYDNIDFDVNQFELIEAMVRHLEKYSSDASKGNLENCVVCNKKVGELKEHLKVHFFRPRCNICDKAYFNSDVLKRHMKNVHEIDINRNKNDSDNFYIDLSICGNCKKKRCVCKRTFQCNTCGKILAHRSSFVRHTLTHTNEKPHTCEYCQKSFLFQSYLNKHIDMVHLGIIRKPNLNQTFICDTCGYTTQKKFLLSQHVLKHSGIKQYKCEYCDKAFVLKNTLCAHRRAAHSDGRSFTCEYCSRSFNVNGSLTKHILDVHLTDRIEKKFTCNYCGKKYRQRCQLTQHLKWHVGDRKFGCDICGRTFVSKHSVKKHRVTHFSEKQHKCEICGKGFHQKSNIKIHMKVHLKV